MSGGSHRRIYRPTYWDELKGAPLTATIGAVLMMVWMDVYRHIPGVPVTCCIAGYAGLLLFWPTIVFATWVYQRNPRWYARLALAAGLIALVWAPILGTMVYWCCQP